MENDNATGFMIYEYLEYAQRLQKGRPIILFVQY